MASLSPDWLVSPQVVAVTTAPPVTTGTPEVQDTPEPREGQASPADQDSWVMEFSMARHLLNWCARSHTAKRELA